MSNEPQIWGIHMDISVGSKPVDDNYVGIGWQELGDLSKIGKDRESFKMALEQAFPEIKPGAIPVNAGVLYRFVHEIQKGDIVVYSSKINRTINLGFVDGPYRHDFSINRSYPNIRPIKWIKHIPRENFSQAALNEIGAFITLFSIKKYSHEFLDAIEGKKPTERISASDIAIDDATITKAVALQAEETTQDFVIRQLKSGIDPYQFEHFVAHLLECMGYHTRVSAKSGDGGVDIIAHKDKLGFEPPIVKVQCKQITNSIGRPEVTQLLGNVEKSEHGLFVTLGSYTRDAREYDRSKPNLRLIDGEQLVELIFSEYKKFDPKYQSLLPLRQIYVPSLKDVNG